MYIVVLRRVNVKRDKRVRVRRGRVRKLVRWLSNVFCCCWGFGGCCFVECLGEDGGEGEEGQLSSSNHQIIEGA